MKKLLLLITFLSIPTLLIFLVLQYAPSNSTLPLKKTTQAIVNKVDPPPTIPWLKTEGNKIVNENGEQVVLHGVNIPGLRWANPSWLTKAVNHAAKKWNAKIIRTRVPQEEFLEDPDEFLDNLEAHILNPARRNGIYVILDPKIREYQPLPDEDTLKMWQIIAERYKEDPHILYDLVAEPQYVTHQQVYDAYNQLIPQIRKVHPKSLIFVTGTGWGRAINPYLEAPLPYHNLVYRSHPYNSAGEFEGLFGLIAQKYPVFITEFGFHPEMTIQDVKDLIEYTNKLNLGWTAWVFHSEGCPCLLENSTTFKTSEYGHIVLNSLLETNSPQETGTNTWTSYEDYLAQTGKGTPIYDDSFQNAYTDLSWGVKIDLVNHENTYTGTNAIKIEFGPESGLYFYSWLPQTPQNNQYLSLYYQTDSKTQLEANLWLKDKHENDLSKVSLKNYTQQAQKNWYRVSIPLKDLNPENKQFSGFAIADYQTTPKTLFIDEIRLPLKHQLN